MTKMSSRWLNFLSNGSYKTVRTCILSAVWLDYFWETYLCSRQYRLTKQSESVPPHLADITTPDIYTLSRWYHMDQMRLGFAKDMFALAVTTSVLSTGLFGKVWTFSQRISPFKGELAVTWLWSLLFTTGTALIYLPFSLYEIFVLEDKYGFNNQTMDVFIGDVILTLIILHIFNLPIYALFLATVKISGNKCAFVLWLMATTAILAFSAIFPTLIDPAAEDITVLPDGPLKDDIETLANSVGFPLGGIYIKSSSQRTSHANAYFAGTFGVKRIVLYDTLLAMCTHNEILAILCHEFAHWKEGHIAERMLAFQGYLMITFYLYACVYRWPLLYQALGFPKHVQPSLIGFLILTSIVMAPINSIATCIFNSLSRRQEYEADRFALKFGKGDDLINALKRLHKGNLADLIYDPLYVMWYHSHPPIFERIEALKKKD